MKRLALVLLLSGSAAFGQDGPEENADPLTRGFKQLLRDLFSDVEPAIRNLRDAIQDLDNYEAPEMLPNGDIIIRRKTPLESEPGPAEPEAEGETEEPIEI